MEVVVPRADDGAIGTTDTSDAPSGASTDRRSTARVAVAVLLAVVIVACLVVLGTRFVRDTDGDASALDRAGQVFVGSDGDSAQAERETVMALAGQFMLRVNTFGPGDLDATNKMPDYTARILELITAKFEASFEENVTLAEQAVSQSGAGRTAELFSTGVESMDDDSAEILVAGSLTGSYPDPNDPSQRFDDQALPFRQVVSMVKVEGEWLVDNFGPVTDTEEVPVPPTQVPAPVPSASATPAPPETEQRSPERSRGRSQQPKQQQPRGGATQ